MATTHVVTLFLPYTAHFHDKDTSSESSPDRRVRAGHPPIRARLSVDLRKNRSATSLIDDGPPASIADELFLQAPDERCITTGNPRALMRSDPHVVSDWGKQAIFNQPQSRAGPLPSGSILKFGRLHEELQAKGRQSRPFKRSTSAAIASRGVSSDNGYDQKTYTIETASHGNGSLANAMRESQDQDIIWHGALDFPTDMLPANLKENIADHLANEFQAQVVYVSDKDFQGCYTGYCKTILWPIFHYLIPIHPKSRAFADHSWQFYTTVNQSFANRVIENYKRGDMIWIHDYHLLLVPQMIRERLPDARIGFFLHCAFPSSEVFRTLWRRKELLEGILGANLVAFQIPEYSEHFLQACSRVLTVETTSNGVQLEDHFVDVISQPIGINLSAIDEHRFSLIVQEWVQKILDKYAGKRIIVARDRLDGVSGVRHKLLSFELFLNKYPEWREEVVLIQVATSASEQADYTTEVGEIVQRIEAAHSSLAHQPIVLLQQDIPFAQYLALLSVADVLIIGPLRDGMNLTAHDYIVCQDGKACGKKHGSLILSEFTGSSAVFGEYSLPVNPWDYQMQVRAIKKALEMSTAEKERRWTHLHDIVVKHSGAAWADSLTNSLRRVHEEHAAHETMSIPRLSFPQVSTAYKGSAHRVFILDYEGTLVLHKTDAGIELGSPHRYVNVLNDLAQDPRNLIYVMSSFMPDELERYFKLVPQIGMIAENGCFLKQAGIHSTEWTDLADMKEVSRWKSEVKEVLKFYLERLEGTYMEERHCSLLLRFDKCEDKAAIARMMGECADHINGTFSNSRVGAVPVSQAVLIESLDHGKAPAVQQVFKHIGRDDHAAAAADVDFLFVAGDDREDESVFRLANALAAAGSVKHVTTVTVGKRNTEAQATITQGTSGLLTVLGRLAKISADAQPVGYFNVKERV